MPSRIAGTPRRALLIDVIVRFFVLSAILFLSACAHPKPAQVNLPAPPPPTEPTEPTENRPAASVPPPKTAPKPREPKPSDSGNAEADLAEPTLPADAHPIATETGLASWYGPPYHNRRGSNGEIYNMHAMTAAHRTYPMGSIVRVTNVKTGATALVRITDRGPFIPGRVVDLSLAAAHKLDVWKPGVAQVKVELMQSAASSELPGKWAVQIGGFPHQPAATKLADHLKRRYRTAQVLCFHSPAGDWWIRIRVLDDDHISAQKLAAETQTPEGAVFLVRLD
jgi:rare lipoprotein A